jgi:hypothetical protein
MFNWLRRRGTQHPGLALREALVKDGLPAGIDPATLGLLEEHARYSGRRVTYVRVFDALRAAELGLQPRAFSDLDSHPELLIAAGHVEQNGTVVFNKRPTDSDAPLLHARDKADRAAHADDEQHVFPPGSRTDA